MQKKWLTYPLLAVLVLFTAYHSVYFKKLDEVKLQAASGSFNAGSYAKYFYNNQLLPYLNNAIDIHQLITLLKSEPEETFRKYSHALAIGNIRYFLVQGEGTVSAVGEDDLTIEPLSDSARNTVKITTGFIYGSAIRDASGLLKSDEFSSTADFNSVAEEINKIVRKEMLPDFLAKVKPGNRITYAGAIELNQAHINLESVEVVPIRLSVLP